MVDLTVVEWRQKALFTCLMAVLRTPTFHGRNGSRSAKKYLLFRRTDRSGQLLVHRGDGQWSDVAG
jgi:hypothetical protein